MRAQPALVLATNNQHKVEEMRAILAPLLPEVDLSSIVSMSQFDVPSPAEDALTFQANALIKARAVARATGLPALADDSGLAVDAMGGAPGIFSARWSGTHGNDVENRDLLLAQIADLKERDRGAQFVCAAALVLPDGSQFTTEGIMRGRLIYEARGENGFGYDPIFVADGYEVTNSELSPTQKNSISHRAKAMRAIAPRLAQILTARSELSG